MVILVIMVIMVIMLSMFIIVIMIIMVMWFQGLLCSNWKGMLYNVDFYDNSNVIFIYIGPIDPKW
jgi:hypothetical protein